MGIFLGNKKPSIVDGFLRSSYLLYSSFCGNNVRYFFVSTSPGFVGNIPFCIFFPVLFHVPSSIYFVSVLVLVFVLVL